MALRTNDRVWITCAGRRVEGRIELASSNEVSLMLEFEAMLGGYVGRMPVLRHEDGVYRGLFDGVPVEIEPMGRVQ